MADSASLTGNTASGNVYAHTYALNAKALAASLDSNDGVYFVPALTGLGSPHWDPYARGTIVGLTRYVNRGHFARAALASSPRRSVPQ